MVQRPRSQGIVFLTDKEDGFGRFTISDGFQNSVVGSGNSKGDGADGFEVSGADSKRIKLVGCNQQVGAINLSEESSPLGLTLKKTPSFLDLIETKLSQGRKGSLLTDANRNVYSEKARAWTDDSVSQPISEKLKASNFPANLLRIGTWETVSRYEVDLVAKCYYAKCKLVWEVLDHGLKSKIEIQWSDISAIRAIFSENEPGVLEIELSHAPLFFRETNPQPKKHTLWQATSDFTGGQASIFRRHYLQFPEGTLEKHYEKLLQCDSRLFMLGQRPFPTLNSPYFQINLNGYPDSSLDFSGYQPEFSQELQFPHLSIHRPPLVPHQVWNFETTIRKSIGAIDSTSPMSVMDFPRIEGNGGNHSIEQQRTSFWGQGINNNEFNYARRGDQVGEPLIASANQDSPALCRPESYHLLSSGDRSRKPPSNISLLNQIANHLLNDPSGSVCSDEQRLLEKVQSMHSLLDASEEVNPMENTGTNYTKYGHKRSMNGHLLLRSTEQSSGGSDFLCPELLTCLRAQDSNENLLMHLPRNTLFPYSIDPAVDDFMCLDPVNRMNQWRVG